MDRMDMARGMVFTPHQWTYSDRNDSYREKSTFSFLTANLSCTGQCFQHGKGVSLVPWYEDTKSFTPSPPKNGFWPKNGQIWPKLAFLAKYQHFWPIWPHGRPKRMQTRCLGGFSVAWVPKLLLPPIRIRNFGPKTAKFGPKYAFLVILGQIWTFSPLFVPCPIKKQCEQGALIVVPKLLLSPVKIGILTKNNQI